MDATVENERELRRMGLAGVKMLIATNDLPQHMMNDAIQWAAREEEKERQRQFAFDAEQKQFASEQRQIARSALKATWIAVAICKRSAHPTLRAATAG